MIISHSVDFFRTIIKGIYLIEWMDYMYTVNFQKPIWIHFIGIGGISMSGLAEILLEKSFKVTGSDLHRTPVTEHLESLGVQISYEQKADIYSLGVICYHLLTGHSLYDARNMEDLVKLTQKGIFKISADISKETVSFLNYMLRYDPKKRLDINQLSKHKFIVNDVKNFQKIDKNQLGNILDGSKLVIDLKKTYIDFLKESMFPEKEEEEEDEFTENWRLKLKEAEIKGNKIKRNPEEEKDIEQRPIKNIEKFIWEAIDKINSDSMSFEPKLIPFIPG